MNKCEECGKELSGEDALPRPDPFIEEIRGEIVMVVLCDECYQKYVWDI